MKRIIQVLMAQAVLAVCAIAQTGYVTVMASHVVDSSGHPEASGTITFAPVNNSGQAISFLVGGSSGGQAVTRPVSAPITNGAFTITLADTNLTSPKNVCYAVKAVDRQTGYVLLQNGYSCVQPAYDTTIPNSWCTGGVCNFDAYVPDLAALTVVQTGPQGPAGPTGPSGGSVVNPALNGVLPDGSDHSSAFSALLTSVYNSGGGIIQFTPGTYVLNSCFTLPNNGDSIPTQPVIRIFGAGSSGTTLQPDTDAPNGGTIIETSCPTGVAFLDTRGTGVLEIAGISFVQTGAGTPPPFIHTTNTRLLIHNDSFYGNASTFGQTSTQDAIILGGTGTTIDGTSTSPFQGYGTVIRENHFARIRRGVLFQTYANGVVVRDNTWWVNSGAPDSTYAAIQFTPASAIVTGNVISGNIIEGTYYPCSVQATNAIGNIFFGNGIYDLQPGWGFDAYCFSTGANKNQVFLTTNDLSQISDTSGGGNNTIWDSSSGYTTVGSPATGTYGLKAVSSGGIGFYGVDSGAGTGVNGTSNSGSGVNGVSASGVGVYGTSTSGEGVRGQINSVSEGVAGINNGTGIGVFGESTNALGTGLRAINTSATGDPAQFANGSGVQSRVSHDGSFSGPYVTVTGAAPNAGTGQINLGATTASTATAGPGSGAMCSTPGYIIINISGTQYKIPYCGN